MKFVTPLDHGIHRYRPDKLALQVITAMEVRGYQLGEVFSLKQAAS